MREVEMTKPRQQNPSLKRARRDSDDDDVGYGKPPRTHQFKPGTSGNPKGRPKGAKSEATILQDLLQQKIGLNERGKTRKITLHEAILRRIVEDCLKGNTKSAAFLLNRYQAMTSGEPEEAGLNEDEKAVLETYLRDFPVNPKREDEP
jgi:hypothetical protein